MTDPSVLGLNVPPGNPTALSTLAGDLRTAATSADKLTHAATAEVATTLSRGKWTGAAADAFAANMRKLAGREGQVGTGVRDMASALETYSTTLARAQREARAGIALVEGQSPPDPAALKDARAKVDAAWTTYANAATDAARAIRAALAELPAPDEAQRPAPARHSTPWYDKVGHWFGHRAKDVETAVSTAGQDTINFFGYLGNHPEDLVKLTVEAGGMTLGVLGMVGGAAGEAGGGLLDLTGIGAAVGVPVNIAAAGLIAGSGALAAGSAEAAGKDLGRVFSESQAESSGGGSAGSGGSASPAPEWQAEGAPDIARGHAGVDHAGDFPGMSLDDLETHVSDVMRNPVESKPLNNGRAAYQGKDGTVVIYDPLHIDQGTVFKPPGQELESFWEGLQ